MTFSFEDYVETKKGELSEVRQLLSEPLSENPAGLVQDLRKTAAWHSTLIETAAHADAFLDRAEAAFLKSAGEGKVIDREKRLAGMVANHRRFRNITTGWVKSIELRISLGQSMLNALLTERRLTQS